MVDDEPDFADLFRQGFRREMRQGTYVLDFAFSAAQALDRLAGEIEQPLVVILSDISVAGMDGLTLLREIKTRRPEFPVMIVTMYEDDQHRRLAAANGAAELLTKPIDFDHLKARLRQLLAAAA